MRTTASAGRRRAVLVLALVVALCTLIALATAATSGASGYVESTFHAPPPPIPENVGWENQVGPQVSQDKVAYRGVSDGGNYAYIWRIGLVDAVTWTEWANCKSFDYANWDPGDVVAYCKYGSGDPAGPDEVWVTNGTTSLKLNLSVGSARNPCVSGSLVVWQEQVSGTDWDIMAAKLGESPFAVTERYTVCAAARQQAHPDIDSDNVVWQDNRSGNWNIYCRSLDGLGGTKRICGNRAKQINPTIDGQWIAWEDNRNRGYGLDIYGRKAYWDALSTTWKLTTQRAICHAKGKQCSPDAGGGDDEGPGYVVWEDWRKSSDHAEFMPPNVDIRGYAIKDNRRFLISPGSREMFVDPDLESLTVVFTHFSGTHHTQPSGGSVEGALLLNP